MQSIPGLELKILNILWECNKPCTVQNIIEKWQKGKKPGYTTVLKKLQVMEKKELVSHNRNGRVYQYSPCLEKDSVRKHRLSSLLSDLFDNEPLSLFSTLVDSEYLNRGDLEQLRNLIDKADKGNE